MNQIGKNDSLTYPEMVNLLTEKKTGEIERTHGQSVYRKQSLELNDQILKSLVHCAAEDLAEVGDGGRIRLEDVQTVQRISIQYLRACEETCSFPSVLGLARCLGYSDRALRWWLQKYPETETGRWLALFGDMCADVLHQSSLKNAANSIVAIFLSKSLYNMVEKSEILLSPGQRDDMEKHVDVEELRRRYLPESERLALEAVDAENRD